MAETIRSALYLVPTPIGNLADMTYRAVDILTRVELIAAEDTRVTGILLKHYRIETRMLSCHKFNEQARVERIVEVLRRGGGVALVTDAGTPGISDPAERVVRGVIDAGFQVIALPGATAVIPALVASGLPSATFFFAGFPPRKTGRRTALFQAVSGIDATLIFYESPFRLGKTVAHLLEVLGDRRVVVARELTKLHETFWRGSLSGLSKDPSVITPKGEIVLLVGPPVVSFDTDSTGDDDEVDDE